MYKLLVVMASSSGMTSQVLTYETESSRIDAADEIQRNACLIGEVVVIFV